MEVNDVRIMFMLMSLIIFVGVTCWAYSPKRRKTMEEAGRYILEDENINTYQNERNRP